MTTVTSPSKKSKWNKSLCEEYMAKFSGMVGFFKHEETKSGVWEEKIVEKHYCGDLIKNVKSYQNSGNVNDNITLSNEISIISDLYANENYSNIRYVELNGTRWKVTNVNIQYPRLVLTVGGVYNG